MISWVYDSKNTRSVNNEILCVVSIHHIGRPDQTDVSRDDNFGPSMITDYLSKINYGLTTLLDST